VTKEDILRKYSESSNNSLLTQELNGKATRTQLKNVVGSGASFIAATAFQHIYKTTLLISPDKEEAAYFLNDLENLLGEENVLFFPASYRMPYEHEEIDNANILLRAEVLNKLATGKKHICIVTYPEALTEKVVTQAHLSKNTLELKQGEKISIDFITDVLIEYDFERVDYVVEPGQFSIRGGIVDIFSFSSDNPYRIEFLGNEVESIRSFDSISQLSINAHRFCNIIPNIQAKILQESRQTFLEFLGEDTVIWFKHFQLTIDRIEKAFLLAETAYDKLDNVIKQLEPLELYTDKDTFTKQALGVNLVEFGNHFSLTPTKTITYNFSPQPSFNKNFNYLLDNLHANIRNGYENIIFC
jgi:transcription-repair coupling factor (superfamily II helicase)